MSTHPAVVTVAPRAPLEIHQVPTVHPEEGEVRVRVEWTASTPLDMHQADGGLLVKHPQGLGDGSAGTVVEVGKGVTEFQVGDQVFGFTFRSNKEKSFQIYIVAPAYSFGKIPTNNPPQAAVTLPNNVVTIFHTLTTDLGLDLPWPRPSPSYTPPTHSETPILIWGAASSTGTYALQILKYYNYTNVLGTASPKHHDRLKKYGVKHLFDYRDPDVVSSITQALNSPENAGKVPLVLDCIGSASGSLRPVSQIATAPSTIVAVLLPVIVRPPSSPSPSSPTPLPPIYSMDAQESAPWSPDVVVRGVRTHFYERNEFYKLHLQTEIVPKLLEDGVIEPNPQRVVEGATLLERAEKALALLRGGAISGERLVWRVWTEKEFPLYA